MPKKAKPNYQQLVIITIKQKVYYFFLGVIVTFFISFVANNYLGIFNIFSKLYLQTNKPPVSKKIFIEKSQIYEIKEGDYLWKIAEEKYGSGFNAYDIANVNKIIDPNNLNQGQKLILPQLTPKEATVGETSSISTGQVMYTGNTYTVQPGDDLCRIAIKVYGDCNATLRIIQANNINNPDIIEVGTILKIPR